MIIVDELCIHMFMKYYILLPTSIQTEVFF